MVATLGTEKTAY